MKGNTQVKEIKTTGVQVPPPELKLSCERVAHALLGAGGEACHLVALRAEPGSGRRETLDRVVELVERSGRTVLRRDLRDNSPEAALDRIQRVARTSVAKSQGIVVCLDEMPVVDEDVAERIAVALRKMWRGGVSVVFSLDPEACLLLDLLPQCTVLSFMDFRVRRVTGVSRQRELTCLRLSRGIPRLVRALLSQEFGPGDDCPLTPAYYDALALLARLSVRVTLSDEERAVRLAMLILGRGTADELARVVGRDVREVMAGIVADAPLFGVGDDLTTFDCLTSLSVASLAACLRRLEASCALFPDLVASCLRVLVDRGELKRAALLASLPEAVAAYDAILGRGADFLDIGEVALVRRVARMADVSDPAGRALLCAASAIGSREEIIEVNEGLGETALLFADARRLLLGLPPLVLDTQGATDDLARRLWAHRVAGDLMASGRFSEAMRQVVATPREEGHPSVSSALLGVDLELARVMCGEPTELTVEDDARAARAFDGTAVPGLVDGAAMVRLVESVLAGDGDAAQAESLAGRAERAGETLVRIVALLAGSVIDLRRSAAARAHVRASIASSLARETGLTYLGRVAELFGWLARLRMGESTGPQIGSFAGDDLGAVCELIVSAVSGSPASPAAAQEVPWDALWLLRVVCRGLGELSELVEGALPATWRRALAAQADSVLPQSDAFETTDARGGVECGAPIRICLLGGFSMYVRGVRVPDWKLEQRSATSMLEYMVLANGARAKRYALVEQVWPDCDYVTGLNRVYQATSLLRQAIADIDRTLDPFVTNRASHEMSLDMSVVTCDVDEFRTVARSASDADDDERALELARRTEALYAGDLYLPPADATGFVAAMRDELRLLYSDAMAAGADAALQLGRMRTAARLARSALEADRLREDAVATLIRALRASGRQGEAEKCYREFVRHLAEEGVAPSAWLTSAAGKAGELSD